MPASHASAAQPSDYSHLPRRWAGQRARAAAGLLLALLLASRTGHAQITPPRASPKPPAPAKAPAQVPKPLPAIQMEEALRMLLKADSVASVRQRARLGPESSGLVVDQTITKIGHDFYDQFYSKWEAPNEVGDFTIVIGEKPARGNNAIVTVTVNDEELLEIPLQSKYELIEDTAQQAVAIAADNLQQAHNLSQQLERGNKQPLEVY